MQILSALEQFEKDYDKPQDEEARVINLNYRDISSIGYIPNRFRFVEELYLNHNSITNLKGIEQFPFLKILSVKFNQITTLDEFCLIVNKKSIISLNLIGNPVARNPSCTRDFFIQIFPNLTELNDTGLNGSAFRYLETSRTPTKPKADSLSFNNNNNSKILNNQSLVIKNFDKAINPPPTTASTARTYTYTQEEYKDRSTVRVPTKMGTHYDSSYMLTDYDRYDNLTPFENQKTATFAKVQALANKNAYARQSLANEEGFEFPQCTERFGDITRIPYSVDQSQINDQSMFAGKSIDISLLKNARVSTVLNTDFKKKNPREDVSYSVIRNTGFDPNQSDSQINNLFEKHIVNIDKDIEDLAKIFHEKSLKERGFLALRMNTEAASEYDTDEENNDKAIQFSNNLSLIRVFYAWTFYVNTNRRKMALIQTISQRNSARSQPLTVRDTNSMGSRTQRDTFGSKGSLSSQSTSRVHTQSKKYNYYLGEDFV